MRNSNVLTAPALAAGARLKQQEHLGSYVCILYCVFVQSSVSNYAGEKTLGFCSCLMLNFDNRNNNNPYYIDAMSLGESVSSCVTCPVLKINKTKCK